MFFDYPTYEPSWFGGGGMRSFLLFVLLPFMLPNLLMIPPMWNLCGRAGFPRWFSFAIIIPLANLTLLYFLAFSKWPSELQARQHQDPTVGPGSP